MLCDKNNKNSATTVKAIHDVNSKHLTPIVVTLTVTNAQVAVALVIILITGYR